MNVKGNHPLAEILAKKLFSIETVPATEQAKMVRRAITAAVEFYEKNNKNEPDLQAPCNYCKKWFFKAHDYCADCGRLLSR